MLDRRTFLQLGLLGGSYVLLAPRRIFANNLTGLGSPPTPPFVAELPIPPLAVPTAPFSTRCPTTDDTLFFEIHQVEALHRFHPALPENLIWGYDGSIPGPTFRARVGQPQVIRFFNDLPRDHRGFGVPNTTIHRHAGFQASESDGFPSDFFPPGTSKDFCYPNVYAGGDVREGQSTLWYHDHLVSFTAPNVYKGLAGMYLMFDEIDSGDETDPNPRALGLPSGEFDIPLVVQDKLFNRNGKLVYNSFDHNGFLGDKFLANGVIQPFLRVARRKYRFRFLDASNARFYQFFLSSGQKFIQIGADDKLLPHPVLRNTFGVAPGQRVDVVVDFSGYEIGDEVILENRLVQTNGRGPDEIARPGTPILKFIVDRDAYDPSQVPNTLRELPPIDLDRVGAKRLFEFNRSDGAWQVNGEFFDEDRVSATPRLGVPEIWTLKNGGGGWFHPIHIHLESFRILSRNGSPPGPHEPARRDTIVLGPGDEVRILIQFRTFRGRYAFHCHNLEHEDMAMMARFDTV